MLSVLYIAVKMDDYKLMIADITIVFDQIFKLKDNKSNKKILDINGPLFILMRDSILKMEQIILKELGYELFKIQDPPHKLLLSYFKLLKSN